MGVPGFYLRWSAIMLKSVRERRQSLFHDGPWLGTQYVLSPSLLGGCLGYDIIDMTCEGVFAECCMFMHYTAVGYWISEYVYVPVSNQTRIFSQNQQHA
jgi:hypothetical protein